MEQKRNITIILAALALVLVGCLLLIAELTGWRPEAGQSQQQAAGETPIPYAEGAAFDVASAPDFAFAGSDGAFASLYDHLGTPILVHFWNGGGDAVVEELHALDRAFANYGEDVQFLIIHTAGEQSQNEAKSLFSREELKLPLFFDADGSALDACGAMQPPVTYFIDAEGFVAAASTGSIDEDTLSFGLSLLNGPGQDEASPAPSAATAAPSESPSA